MGHPSLIAHCRAPALFLYSCCNQSSSSLPLAAADSGGNMTLVADLGCFMFESNHELLAALTKDEAAIYECFTVKVDHVSAYLLEGEFAWPTANEQTGGAAAASSAPAAAASGVVQGEAKGPRVGLAALMRSSSVGAGTALLAGPGVRSSMMGNGAAGGASLMELLSRRAHVVTLLERFGAGLDLQLATSMHPR